jgi:orotate phosphoribosyltransferase
MVSIFTYGFDVATEAFLKAGIPFRSMTNYQSLISLAIEKGQVNAEEERILLNWRDNPSNWSGV